jgi:hypothetical protein
VGEENSLVVVEVAGGCGGAARGDLFLDPSAEWVIGEFSNGCLGSADLYQAVFVIPRVGDGAVFSNPVDQIAVFVIGVSAVVDDELVCLIVDVCLCFV